MAVLTKFDSDRVVRVGIRQSDLVVQWNYGINLSQLSFNTATQKDFRRGENQYMTRWPQIGCLWLPLRTLLV